MSIKRTFRDHLLLQMQQHNVSPRALAHHLGMSESYLSRSLNEKNVNPKLETIDQFAQFFGITVAELFIEKSGLPSLIVNDVFVLEDALVHECARQAKLAAQFEKGMEFGI